MRSYIDEVSARGKKAAAWLSSQVDARGSLPCDDDLGCYYKCVTPLRLAGYSTEASLLLGRVLRLFLRADGDLSNPGDRKTSGTYTSFFCQCYPNGWIAQGAFLLGRFDAFRLLMDGLLRNYYDPGTGSFRSSHAPETDVVDVNSTATALELFLLCDMPKARRAADLLCRFVEEQPDPARWFYTRIRPPFVYVTQPDPRSETYSAIRIGEERQGYWMLGLPCAVLVQAAEATGEERYLEAAERYFDVFLSCGEPAFRWITSGKSAWAAAMLYRLTGKEKYAAALRRIVAFLSSLQAENGCFLFPGMTMEQMSPKLLFDETPEYIKWYLDIAAELAALPGGA